MSKILFILISFFSFLSLTAQDIIIPRLSKLPEPGKWRIYYFKNSLTFSGLNSIGGKAGQPRLESFQIHMLHDKRNLALLVQIRIPPKSDFGVKKQIRKQDNGAYKLELFFVPDIARPHVMYQLEIGDKGKTSVFLIDGRTRKSWKCPDLTAAASVLPGLRDIQIKVPLASLGLKPDKPFKFNAALTDHFSAGNSRWSFSPLQEPEKFISVKFGDSKTAPALYKSSPYAEQILDGGFEFGMNEWRRTGGVRRDNKYVYDGKNCLKILSIDPTSVNRCSKTILAAPGEILRVYGAVHFQALEQPDFSPARVEFLDSGGKVISTVKAPGLKNMGGGTTPHKRHAFCEFFAAAPEGAKKARLVWHLDGTTGIMRIDAVSFRRLYPDWKIPTLLYPVYGQTFAQMKIPFAWSELVSNRKSPAVCSLEIAADKKFESDLIRIENVYPGHKQELPKNGKWFWRLEINESGKKQFTETSEFTIFCTPENEKMPPVITSCEPSGLTPVRPKELVINIYDYAVSSGIDPKRVKLWVNGVNVSPQLKVFPGKLVWPVPNNNEKLFHYKIQVKDKNRNCGHGAGFFYVRSQPHVISMDKQNFILRDGKRIFPVSFYAVPWYKTYPKIRAGGLNANFSPWATDIDMIMHLQQAAKEGMYITPFVFDDERILRGEVSPDSSSGKIWEAEKFERVLKLKDHPNTVGFYIGDEDMDGRGTLPEQARRWYWKIKKAAPNQIVFWLPTYKLSDPERVKHAVGACDCLVWHHYGYNKGLPLLFVSTYAIIKKATNDMPHLFIVEAFKNGPNGRLPTLEFLRFQSFFGIIERSRGLIFYASTRNWPDYMKTILKVTRELNSLQDALLADDVHDLHRFVPGSSAIRSVGKKVGDQLYIFVVNVGASEYKGKISAKWENPTLDGKPAGIDPDGGVKLVLPSMGSALLKGKLL